MTDFYTTPLHIAEYMLSICKLHQPRIIADFCVGHGDLLFPANRHWRKALLLANDIDNDALSQLNQLGFDGLFYNIDFSNFNNTIQSPLKDYYGCVDLILLNPPYSCRGNSRFQCSFLGNNFSCSRSMQFILNSLHFLSTNGQLIAITPSGSLYSEKDAQAWSFINKHYQLETHTLDSRRLFKGCYPRVTIVSILTKQHHSELTSAPNYTSSFKGLLDSNLDLQVKIYRGNSPVHKAVHHHKGIPFVHSTDVNENGINTNRLRVMSAKSVSGPLLTFLRVGKPTTSKLQSYFPSTPIVLSDCLFALQTRSQLENIILKTILTDNWKLVEDHYGGTGAKYITKAKLYNLLLALGIKIIHHSTANVIAFSPDYKTEVDQPGFFGPLNY